MDAYSLQEITQLISSKQFSKARDLSARLCKKNKNDIQARVMLGMTYSLLEQYEQSEKQLLHALKMAPNDAQIHYNLGSVFQNQAKYKQAIKSYKLSIKYNPALFESNYNLGFMLLTVGQLNEAECIFKKLLKTNTYLHLIHYQLASISYLNDDFDVAMYHCKEALSHQRDFDQAYVQQGRILYKQNKYKQALEAYKQALKYSPSLIAAHVDLGDIYSNEGDLAEAAKSLERAINYGCNESGVYMKLGNIYILKAQPIEAMKYFNVVIDMEPNNSQAIDGAGRAWEGMGEPNKAIELYKRSLALEMDNEHAIAGMGRMYVVKGEYNQALTLLAPVIKNGAKFPDIVSVYSDINIYLGQTPAAIKALETFLKKSPKDINGLNKVYYQLGKIYDSIEHYDKAFNYFMEANRLSTNYFTTEKQLAFIDAMISAFTSNKLSSRPPINIKSELPIFIIGMPRSGTTLVEQILDSHPQIHGAGELLYIGECFERLVSRKCHDKRPFPDNMDLIEDGDLVDEANKYLDILSKNAHDALRVTDKLPHNFIYLGLISRLFPNARIIHCCRNSVDTCLSIYFNDMDSSHAYATDLKNLGDYYCQYLKMMTHWKSSLNLPILDIQYEELVGDQEHVSKRVIEFCGLEWDERCLNFHENKRSVTTHSSNQVRQKLYSRSVERWRNYEENISELFDALKFQVH